MHREQCFRLSRGNIVFSFQYYVFGSNFLNLYFEEGQDIEIPFSLVSLFLCFFIPLINIGIGFPIYFDSINVWPQ